MKLFRYLAVLSLLVSTQAAFGSASDTFDLMGGSAQAGWGIGWYGEAWRDSAWCGDTLYKDLTPETVIRLDTIVLLMFTTIQDTLYKGTDTQQVVAKDTLLPDTTITSDTTVIDSSTFLTCVESDLVSDTGALVTGNRYINFNYKFRNWYAQLPIIWSNWQGLDSLSVIPYSRLLITYKGLLSTHQANLEFIYGTWGPNADTTKSTRKLGDGVGIVTPSSTWETLIIEIPDSVHLPGITGLVFNIGNIPNAGGDKTSGVGNLMVDRVSLLVGSSIPVRHKTAPRISPADRFSFIPKSSGTITVSIYTLKGELIHAQSVSVESGRQYSVKRLAPQRNGMNNGQMRIIRVQGAGVNINEKFR